MNRSQHQSSTRIGRTVFLLTVLATNAVLYGCGTPPVYRDEAFRLDTPYSKRIAGSEKIVCGSVRRALLSQGYALESSTEPEILNATKAFQQDEQMVMLRVQTTCMDNGDGSYTVYACAQQETSELQPIKQPLGVTIGTIAGLTIPSGSARIPVTVRRETIQDADFYARLYKLIEQLASQAPR